MFYKQKVQGFYLELDGWKPKDYAWQMNIKSGISAKAASRYVTHQNKTMNLIGWATSEAAVQTYSESSFVSSVCSFSLSKCSLDRYCLMMLSSTCVIVYFLKARYCRRNQREEEDNRRREKLRKKRNTERIGLLTNAKIICHISAQ